MVGSSFSGVKAGNTLIVLEKRADNLMLVWRFNYVFIYMGIFAATLFQKSHRLSNCVRSRLAKPAALILNSVLDESGGTPVSFGPVSFIAFGSEVLKKLAKAPL